VLELERGGWSPGGAAELAGAVELAGVLLAELLPEGVTAALASGGGPGERRRPWRAAAALASGSAGERRRWRAAALASGG
jgi:hypothetical protein